MKQFSIECNRCGKHIGYLFWSGELFGNGVTRIRTIANRSGYLSRKFEAEIVCDECSDSLNTEDKDGSDTFNQQ